MINFTYTVTNVVDHGLNQFHNKLDNVYDFLENINLGEKLTTCTINSFYHRDFFKNSRMFNFMTRHKNIKHLSLNSPHFRKELSDEILDLIVNTLKCVETLKYNGKNCSIPNIK